MSDVQIFHLELNGVIQNAYNKPQYHMQFFAISAPAAATLPYVFHGSDSMGSGQGKKGRMRICCDGGAPTWS